MGVALNRVFHLPFQRIVFKYFLSLSFSIPSLMPTIQDRLLDSISMVLSKSPYLGRPAQSIGRGTNINVVPQVSELSGSALIQLALQTLARFNFKVLYTHFMY
jgi:serine/threonine-protein kinase mTOR